MRVVTYIYDSADTPEHVEQVLDLLADRDEEIAVQDVAAGDREDSIRDALLEIRSAVRIGTTPEELYDDDGNPDLSTGALITEAPTGRRTLSVGPAAVEALREED
jgi:hypothetical protein